MFECPGITWAFLERVMIKIFAEGTDFPSKVNFVDENNVFLGYDLSQDCCEQADWFISDKIEFNIPEDGKLAIVEDLSEFSFDTEFKCKINMNGSLDEGECAVFRIVKEYGKEKFIHIFNSHNGYYSHGFEFKNGEEVISGGCL
jgi:hypothetical protein